MSKKLCEAPDSVKYYFDDQAKETNYHSSENDESNEDDDEEDYESESTSDIDENEKENSFDKMKVKEIMKFAIRRITMKIQ